jgi:hypothetical protein
MKCPLCDQRKAKRLCPAKNGMICPQCCGEKRVLEIDCPESCEFLQSGREREAGDYAKRLRSLDENTQKRNERVVYTYQDVVAHLEYTLARERLSSRDLADKDVSEAVHILLETYRTEDKGILYEKTSDDLRIDLLRRELRSVIEKFRNPGSAKEKGIVDPQSTHLPLGAAIECLEYVQSLVESFKKDRHSPSGYLNFLARIMPREEMPSNSILMP